MRSGTSRRPCVFCGSVTSFEWELAGPRGHRRWLPCCAPCGENDGARRFRCPNCQTDWPEPFCDGCGRNLTSGGPGSPSVGDAGAAKEVKA